MEGTAEETAEAMDDPSPSTPPRDGTFPAAFALTAPTASAPASRGFYVRGLDRDYREIRQICRALDVINRRTQWLDGHPDIEDHPGEKNCYMVLVTLWSPDSSTRENRDDL